MNGGIGLISSRLLAEGPIVKDKGSFLIAGRGSYAHLFLKLTDNKNSAYFYDLNTKLNYKLRNLNPYDNDAKALQAQLTALVPQMARGIFGEVGVLTDQDVARYTQILPNLQGTEKYNIAVMAMLNKAIANSIKNKLKVWAASKRDVS